MITAEEFVQELNRDSEKQSPFKLGIVVELFENDTAKIKFDGEDTPSEKQYAYLASYKPAKDDRVLLCSVGGTYIILGKVSYNEEPDKTIENEINGIKNNINTINGEIDTVIQEVNTVKDEINTVKSEIEGIEDTLDIKIESNMSNDVNGNRNIWYMYVDPNTGELWVRRKNRLWTSYQPKS